MLVAASSALAEVAAAVPKRARARAYQVAVCALFMVVGPTIILLNKQILTALQFRCPIALSFLDNVASGSTSAQEFGF